MPASHRNVRVYGYIELHDKFLIALFDKSLYPQHYSSYFKDAQQAGHMIYHFYQHQDDNALAKAQLAKMTEYVQQAQALLQLHKEQVEHHFDLLPAQQQLINTDHGVTSCAVTWDNQIFLIIMDLLKLADDLSQKTHALRRHEALPKPEYYKWLKRGVRPIRALFNQITLLKRDFDLASPSHLH